MKKISLLFCLILLVSGCATYKFQKGSYPHENGYVALRDGKQIPEYTLGPQNLAPGNIGLAKERFKRRKNKVEYYYKKMGSIESRAKEMFWNPPVFLVDFITGFFRLPFIIAKDRRYERDPVYRQKVDQDDEKQFAREEELRKQCKEQLAALVTKDLEKEGFIQAEAAVLPPSPEVKPEAEKIVSAVSQEAPIVVSVAPAVVSPEPAPKTPVALEAVPPPAPAKKVPLVKKVKEKSVALPPQAVIIARPRKGYSPLTVHLYGSSSRCASGRIIAYEWDFGDGDVSTKKNPINTYWSATYGSKTFTVKLTVTDSNGNSAVSTAIIEVVTK